MERNRLAHRESAEILLRQREIDVNRIKCFVSHYGISLSQILTEVHLPNTGYSIERSTQRFPRDHGIVLID